MKLPGFLQRNKSDESAVPEDLQQYYSTGKPSIMQWILRVVIFAAVLALLVWAGIWLFNKLTNNNDSAVSNPTTAQQTDAQKKAADDAKKAADDKAKAQADAQMKTAAANAKAADEAKKAQDEAKKAADEANKKIAEAQREANSGTATPAPAPTAAAPAASNLPNTGPSSTAMAAIFGSVTGAGAFLHSLYTRRRHNA